MKDEVERGDRIERGVVKESKEGFEVVRETATDIVCMRLVSLMVVEHFSCLLKIMFTSFTSGFTSLSMEFPWMNSEDLLCLVSRIRIKK